MKVSAPFTWGFHGYQRLDFRPGDDLPEDHEAAGYALGGGFATPLGVVVIWRGVRLSVRSLRPTEKGDGLFLDCVMEV